MLTLVETESGFDVLWDDVEKTYVIRNPKATNEYFTVYRVMGLGQYHKPGIRFEGTFDECKKYLIDKMRGQREYIVTGTMMVLFEVHVGANHIQTAEEVVERCMRASLRLDEDEVTMYNEDELEDFDGDSVYVDVNEHMIKDITVKPRYTDEQLDEIDKKRAEERILKAAREKTEAEQAAIDAAARKVLMDEWAPLEKPIMADTQAVLDVVKTKWELDEAKAALFLKYPDDISKAFIRKRFQKKYGKL